MFGEKLKELRTEKNLKQEELGEILGVSKATISSWEMNRTQPPFETIEEIIKYFNVSPNHLFGFTQEDITKIKQLNQVAREAGLIKGEDMTMEEFKKAIDIVEVLRGNNDQMEKKN